MLIVQEASGRISKGYTQMIPESFTLNACRQNYIPGKCFQFPNEFLAGVPKATPR
jgi:hypothetical protein